MKVEEEGWQNYTFLSLSRLLLHLTVRVDRQGEIAWDFEMKCWIKSRSSGNSQKEKLCSFGLMITTGRVILRSLRSMMHSMHSSISVRGKRKLQINFLLNATSTAESDQLLIRLIDENYRATETRVNWNCSDRGERLNFRGNSPGFSRIFLHSTVRGNFFFCGFSREPSECGQTIARRGNKKKTASQAELGKKLQLIS
jgi:hypothetical protein